MQIKKLFMENINPHVTNTIRVCHRHINFFAYEPKKSFSVIIHYYEYDDPEGREFPRDLIKIDIGNNEIDSWGSPDDLHEQVDDMLHKELQQYLEGIDASFDDCFEDVAQKIQFCIERDGISIDDNECIF